MQHPNLFFIFEALGALAFVVILGREIYQKNWHKVAEIFAAFAFGMLLEINNIYFGHTYSYSDKFSLMIGGVPLGIGMLWAVIIYSAMLLSDQYRLPWQLRPLMDAVTALIFDLYADVVAVNLGFWTWTIPKNQEWYGIPFDNLAGWVFVVLSFSFLMRFIRTLNMKKIIPKLILAASPLLAYFGLALMLVVFGFISGIPFVINNYSAQSIMAAPDIGIIYNPQTQLWKTIVFTLLLAQILHTLIHAIIKYRKNYVWRFDVISFGALTGMHIFILTTMFTSGLYRELPFFIFVGFAMFTLHLLMHFLPHMLQDKKILYVFKDTEKFITKEEKAIEKLIDKKLR